MTVNSKFFATPAVWTSEMSNDEWQWELHRMLKRSQLTSDFIGGRITPDDFADGLDELGIDVIQASQDWETGLVYL